MEREKKNTPPITFATRLVLPEQPTRRSRRRHTDESTEKPVLSEARLREEAAWKQVEETGKPVLLDDTLLMPSDMSLLDAVEYLPEDVREQTRSAARRKITEVYMIMVKSMRAQIIEKAKENPEGESYNTMPYAAQLAIADWLVRRDLKWPDVPIEKVLEEYGLKKNSETGYWES